MLYEGGGFVIEAIGEGVRRRALTVSLGEASLAIALRRRNLTPQQQRAVLAAASGFEAKNLPYDALGAAGAGVATGSKGAALTGYGCAVFLPLCPIVGGALPARS